MREIEFRNFLINFSSIESKTKAVNSRVAKALMVERQLNINLEQFVKDDGKMYELLLEIEDKMNDRKHHGVYQNAVRKYYRFERDKEFPRIKDYERANNLK